MKTYLKWHWAYQWDLSFNPDIKRQAQEIIFLERRMIQVIHLLKKHLGLFSVEKLSLLERIDVKIKKARLGVNLMRNLNLITTFVLANSV